jgi:hypothetical protein
VPVVLGAGAAAKVFELIYNIYIYFNKYYLLKNLFITIIPET